MKKSILLLTIAAIVAGFAGCNDKEKSRILYDKKYIKEIKEARKEASFYITRNYIPGATFAISIDGKIIYSEAMGLASKDLEVPVTRDTKFRIGELSELFTSLIYFKMIEEGLLHPDSTVHAYIKDYPKLNFELPIKHLANHTSGIRVPNNMEEDWRGLNVTLEDGLNQFKNDSLLHPPGFDQFPGMYNYNLLGAIMEKASGKNFKDILKDYVTDTLGLTNTLIDNPFATIPGRTDFYDKNLVAFVVNATFRDMRYRAPSKGLLSNAEDLVRFGNAFLYSDYINDELKKDLYKSVKLQGEFDSNMANGWFLLTDRSGKIIYGRQGSVTGGGAAILVYPEEKIVIAAAVNTTGSTDEIPVFQMIKPFLYGLTEETE